MAGRFDLDSYEPVAARIAKFWAEFPNGRIATEILPAAEGEWVVKSEVFRDVNDLCPAASGLAHEVIGDGHVNKTSALENSETSSIGRALANLGFATGKERPSREEMAKVERGSVEKKDAKVRPKVAPQVAAMQDALRHVDDRERRTEIGEMFKQQFGAASEVNPEEYSTAWDFLWDQIGHEMHPFAGMGQFDNEKCSVCGTVLNAPWHAEAMTEPFELTGGPPPAESEKPPAPFDTSEKAKIKTHDALATWSADEVDEALAEHKLPRKGTLAQRRISLGNKLMLLGIMPDFRGGVTEGLPL